MYAFPPFSMVARTIQKVMNDAVEDAILVVPDWPAQPWYGLLGEILTDHPRRLPVTRNTLYLPQDKERRHPYEGIMDLLVLRCSGVHTKVEEFLNSSSIRCSKRDVTARIDNTQSICKDGGTIVSSQGLIPIMLM